MVQVIHRFLELLVLSAWSLGEKLMFRTEPDETTRSWYYLQILIGYGVRSSFLIALFSTLKQHSAIAMGMVESQKIRYPSGHPTVLQRISGLIPSLWSFSGTKFPYGNVDCALEKTASAPSVCNGKTSCLRFRAHGCTWHVSCCTKKCDELPVAFEAQTCSI